MRLQNFDNRFLYVIKYLDKDISKYLNRIRRSYKFLLYCRRKKYRYKNIFCNYLCNCCKCLLFVSISIAIRFSSRFFRSINNLINASVSIGEG